MLRSTVSASFKVVKTVAANIASYHFDMGDLNALAACIETVRMILSVANVLRWEYEHVEMKRTFYAHLKHQKIYV